MEKDNTSSFDELLSAQKGLEQTPADTPKITAPAVNTAAGDSTLLKMYRKQIQRENEQYEHPEDFPEDYFFCALAELVLE